MQGIPAAWMWTSVGETDKAKWCRESIHLGGIQNVAEENTGKDKTH